MSDQSSLDVGLVAGGSGNLEVMAISVAGDGTVRTACEGGEEAAVQMADRNHRITQSPQVPRHKDHKILESSKLKPRYAQQP